jgi:hypothetical protein
MQLSEHGRIQDDKGHEIDHLLNANPFLDNFDTVDYEILAQTMCINPLPNLLIQQENEVGIGRELVEATEKTPASGCFDGDTPTKSQPSRAARIALKRAFHTEASCSPPRAPLTTTSAVLPPSIEHLSLPNTSANSANTASYTLPPHPIQKCSSAPEPTTSASTAVVPLTAAEMTKFPDWLNSWYLRFSKLPYSQAWLKLVNQWTALEKGYGFKSPVCMLI